MSLPFLPFAKRTRSLLSVIALASCVAGVAFALSSGAARASDGQPPETRLGALDADAAHGVITAEARDKARTAIERSKRFRAAGDEVHAKLSDRAAAAWLSAAEDLVKTSDEEAAADDRRRAALDAGAQADRERALVEETMLQNGRLRAELDQLERDAKEPAIKPASKPDAVDGGARPPRVPPAPRAKKDGGAP
jgi:hypothetical protein